MRIFVSNLALAVLWMAISGVWSALGFFVGFVIGALIVSILPSNGKSPRYGIRLFRIGKLFAVFLKELSLSVYRVARLVLSPEMKFTPGIFLFPLTVTSDFEIALLANLVTLTPGTLTVDVTDDRKSLLVHAVDCPDPDAARKDIAEGFERLILEAFR
jgi:multicomponent Na+:H+ antiporter subunit E